MSILLDTGFLYAFLAANDKDHEGAVSLMRRLAAREFGTPVVTDLTIAEFLTLVRVRRRDGRAEEAARALLPLPESDIPGLVTLDVGTHAYGRVWHEFARHRNRGLSFVDASHLVIMDDHQIDSLATFESGFDGLVPVLR